MSNVKNYTEFVVPSSVVSRADISRLVREFEAVDTALTSKTVREKAGAQQDDSLVFSPQLQEFLDKNPVNLDDTNERTDYVQQLRTLKDKAPIMNMTFAVVTDPDSLKELVVWLRNEVHPQTVIEAHLQPALVAGVYLRTPNHVLDLSVRNKLKSKRAELEHALGAPRG